MTVQLQSVTQRRLMESEGRAEVATGYKLYRLLDLNWVLQGKDTNQPDLWECG